MIKINPVPITKLYTSWRDSLDYLEDTERLRRIPLNLQLLREPYKRKKEKKKKQEVHKLDLISYIQPEHAFPNFLFFTF